jgi:hypothetical protein
MRPLPRDAGNANSDPSTAGTAQQIDRGVAERNVLALAQVYK